VEKDTARMLVGYSDRCVCLEPERMRVLIRGVLVKAAGNYAIKFEKGQT